MTVIAAALTSFYSWRLIFMTFFGERVTTVAAGHADMHADGHAHANTCRTNRRR